MVNIETVTAHTKRQE